MAMLNTIRNVLLEDSTDYRIVINLLYNQLKLDTTDLRALQQLLGKDKVFDFSGINDITESKYNYYETSHYRPFIAARIMNVIYK